MKLSVRSGVVAFCLLVLFSGTAFADRYAGLHFSNYGSGAEFGNTNAVGGEHLVAFSFYTENSDPHNEDNTDYNLGFNLKFGFSLSAVSPCYKRFYLTATGGILYHLDQDANILRATNLLEDYDGRKDHYGIMGVGFMIDLEALVIGMEVNNRKNTFTTIGIRF